MRDDPSWPAVGQDMVRIQVVNGRFGGLVVDLPEAFAEIKIGQLVATADGLYNRGDNCRPIPAARVLRLPASAARRVVTPTVCPSFL